jgi:hypothetical protein
MLTDENGRIMLIHLERDVTGSFVSLRDVVTNTYIGWDSDKELLIRVDGGLTTRNMLSVRWNKSFF